MNYIKNKDDFDSAVASSKNQPILIDFYADWCGPCRILGPTLEQVVSDGYNVYKLNVDDVPDIASNLKIKSIPTMVFMVNTIEKERITGNVPKTKIIEIFNSL